MCGSTGKCSYLSLDEVCTKISQSDGSDWTKVTKWKNVLSSLDLANIECSEDLSGSLEKRVIQVTSVNGDDLFDFNFNGSTDEDLIFEGHGKYCRYTIMNTFMFICK